MALPAVDITLQGKELSDALSRRANAAFAITRSMAYLSQYTTQYMKGAGETVIDSVKSTPGKADHTFAKEAPVASDKEYTFDKKVSSLAELAAFNTSSGVVTAVAHRGVAQLRAPSDAANCPPNGELMSCVEKLANKQQDDAVDAIEKALIAEVKRMGAAMFAPQPKSETEFLCKFDAYAAKNHYRSAHPLVHPSDHEHFPVLLLQRQRKEKETKDCPVDAPPMPSLDLASHRAQEVMVDAIHLAQFYEVQRSVHWGLSVLQKKAYLQGQDVFGGILKSFDPDVWVTTSNTFRGRHPLDRWTWNLGG